jgi:uncharacterized protein (DUF2062 family)
MQFRKLIRLLHRWGISRSKLKGGFLHSKLGDRLLEKELWLPTRESFARAWLIGIPISIIPFLPGQSVLACSLGFWIRANIPVCFALQYLSNPATLPVHLPACYLVGELVRGGDLAVAWHRALENPMAFATGQFLISLYVGAVVLGIFLGVAGYGLIQVLPHRKSTRKRGGGHAHSHRHPARKKAS